MKLIPLAGKPTRYHKLSCHTRFSFSFFSFSEHTLLQVLLSHVPHTQGSVKQLGASSSEFCILLPLSFSLTKSLLSRLSPRILLLSCICRRRRNFVVGKEKLQRVSKISFSLLSAVNLTCCSFLTERELSKFELILQSRALASLPFSMEIFTRQAWVEDLDRTSM